MRLGAICHLDIDFLIVYHESRHDQPIKLERDSGLRGNGPITATLGPKLLGLRHNSQSESLLQPRHLDIIMKGAVLPFAYQRTAHRQSSACYI